MLARRVAEDLKVDEVSAEFVIRDVIIGEDYSFLMDACVLKYLKRTFHNRLMDVRVCVQTRLATFTGKRSTCCASWHWSGLFW